MPEYDEKVKQEEIYAEKGLSDNDQIKLEIRSEIKDEERKGQNKTNQIIFHTQPIHDIMQQMAADKAQPERIRCTCARGRCAQKYCVCLKAGLPCDPKLCSCKCCENDDRNEAVERRKE